MAAWNDSIKLVSHAIERTRVTHPLDSGPMRRTTNTWCFEQIEDQMTRADVAVRRDIEPRLNCLDALTYIVVQLNVIVDQEPHQSAPKLLVGFVDYVGVHVTRFAVDRLLVKAHRVTECNIGASPPEALGSKRVNGQ